MSSEAQRNSGWIISDIDAMREAPLIDFCGKIPDHPDAIAALCGTIYRLGKWFNWERSYIIGDTRAAQASEIMRELLYLYFHIGNCDGGTMFELRQSPTNPCVLEQSTDGGLTWATAFNYNLCTSTSEEGILDAINQLSDQVQDFENLLQQYTDDPAHVPDNITDNDNALCWTIREFVTQVIAAVKEERQQQGGEMMLAGGLLGGVTLAIGAIIGIATVGVGLLVMGIAAAVMAVAGAVWAGLSDELLNDEAAIEKVICCMYDALSGTVPTRATLVTSLDSCGFDPLSNEGQLAGALSATLAETELQMTFFEMLSTAIEFSDNIPPQDCDCTEYWEWEADLTLTDGGFVTASGDWIGQWVSGEGWKPENDGGKLQIYIHLLFSRTNVTRLEVDLDFDKDNSLSSGISAFNYQLIDGTTTRFNYNKNYNQVPGGNEEYRTTHDIDIMADKLRLSVRPRVSGTNPADAAVLRVRMEGVGPKPPELI